MTEQSAAPAAPIEPAVVPAAALASVQAELTARDEALAVKEEQLKLAEESIAAKQKELEATQALNKALEERRIAAEVRAEALSKDANFTRASSKARWRIRIDEGREKSDVNPVPVGANGRVYQIRRMRLVDVPLEVVSILNDAVVGRATPIVDERTGIEAGVEFVPARRHPFENFGQSMGDDGELLPGFDPLPTQA